MGVAGYDVVVIGGGAAGLVAALRSAGNGLRTALVERDRLGGECLWTGCIPAKTMLYAAEVRHLMERADAYGLAPCRQEIDWQRVLSAKDEVVAEIARLESPEALAQAGVALCKGSAHLRSPYEVEVDGRLLRTRNVIIATGSRQAPPRQMPGLAEVGYITHVEAVSLPSLPPSLAIIGGGPVGVEFAQIFARLGVRVTVLERSRAILVKEDPEVSAYLQRVLVDEGITVLTDCAVQRASRRAGKKVLSVQLGGHEAEVVADEVMLATGRLPNLEGLGVEDLELKRTPAGLVVDDELRTSLPNVYACGDVTGLFLLNHTATYQARIAVHNITFPDRPQRADYRVVPWVTFTDPEAAHLGLTEPEARARGLAVAIEHFPFSRLDRALTMRKSAGLVKVVADADSGEIVGAHIVGPGASNIIHEYALAMRAHLPLTEIAETIHAYPTLAEALKWTAERFVAERPRRAS